MTARPSDEEASPADSLTNNPAVNQEALTARGQKRRKRGVYASKACNECRRRKVKCKGNRPCDRCTRNGLPCTFPAPRDGSGDASELQLLRSKIVELEEQLQVTRNSPNAACGLQPTTTDSVSVPTLDNHIDVPPPARAASVVPTQNSADISEGSRSPSSHVMADFSPAQPLNPAGDPYVLPSMRAGTRSIDFTASRTGQTTSGRAQQQASELHMQGIVDQSNVSQTQLGDVHTPATAHYKYNISLAQSTLGARGLSQAELRHVSSILETRASPPVATAGAGISNVASDPIWLISRAEGLRLCEVYEEEIGIAYPFLNKQKIVDKVNRLYDALETALRSGLGQIPLCGITVITPPDLNIVKLVLACALTIETSGSSAIGERLYNNVKDTVANLIWGEVTVSTIVIYLLLANWQFLADNDYLAWRLTGIVARWCLEKGLNQVRCLQHICANEEDRTMAVRLFWCIHTLDRRWSFGSGLPFVIQDHDIDRHFPEPDDDVPYLRAMVSFSRIVSDVWYATYSTPVDTSSRKGQEEISYLEYRIARWWDQLPVALQLSRGDQVWSRGMQRLRLLLHLRKSQLTILLHQPVLQTPARIRARPEVARSVVDTAKDVIQKLTALNKTTNIYQTQQMLFNHFLVLALGVIFLAVSQAPLEFANSVQEEFHGALDLVQQLSANSVVSKRLWRTIRGLRQLGNSLGISPTENPVRQHTTTTAGPEEAANPVWRSNCGNGGGDLDFGIFSFDDDLDMPLIFPDEPVDGLRLSENLEAVFERMQNNYVDMPSVQHVGGAPNLPPST